MNVIDVLNQVDSLLDRKSHWTQKTTARDIHNHCVPADDPRAVCWCVLGAVLRSAGSLTGGFGVATEYVLEKAVQNVFPSRGVLNGDSLARVAAFNDHPDTTFEDVREIIQKAKELAKEQANG